MVDFAKETIKGKLVDDTEVDIVFYKYINMPQKQEILRKYTDKLKVKGNEPIWEVDFSGLYQGVLDKLFVESDNNFKVTDIVPESVEEYIGKKVQGFLTLGMGSTNKSTD
jgi:hypothetical protein